jgi:hypothetical protein
MIASVPDGIAVAKDTFGNYMVVTGSALVQVMPTGAVTSKALAPASGPSPSNWVAIASDSLGNVIVADNHAHEVWRITPGSLFSLEKEVASYPVFSPSQSEDAAVAVDPSGNYLVLEDNGGSLHLYSITPAGTVTPIALSGATATSFNTSLIPDGAGNYVFASSVANALFRVTPAGVVTQIAGHITVTGGLTSVTQNPDTGDFYVTDVADDVLQISADGSSISQVANVPGLVRDMIAETYGDLPHLAAGDVWTTGFYILNTGDRSASYWIGFFDDAGNPVSLPLPSGSSESLQGTLPARGMTYVEAANPTAALMVGSGLISADATITVQALFREHAGGGVYYEAGVAASAGSTAFTIPFDATTFPPTGAALYTGFALANLDPANSAGVTCIATDSTGATIPNGVPLPALSPLGHYANYLFPALTGKQGTLNCSANTLVAAIALRSIGGSAFSSLPVLYK